ncbi:MAG TPA: hypothetical protein VFX23_06400, partial [Limnobacter sp.]|uniref:hypothetical protein n=1 Tax=Limnobacter sp. TaxID=2003368 RepID=UPI002E33563D
HDFSNRSLFLRFFWLLCLVLASGGRGLCLSETESKQTPNRQEVEPGGFFLHSGDFENEHGD